MKVKEGTDSCVYVQTCSVIRYTKFWMSQIAVLKNL